MLADLDNESSRDPALAGSKAAQLAVARLSGLPVLPGFVVTAPTSRRHMRLGAEALTDRGSGGARLVVSSHPIEEAEGLIDAARALGAELVARSSTLLEASGEWAGAFTSYGDLAPEDVPKAVAGCWASAFSVDALERQNEAGIAPGSVEMAVLVQPALRPRWAGVAELREDGAVVVHAVEGAPAPLLQGWAPGEAATGHEGRWAGDLVGHLGEMALDAVAEVLVRAREVLGANRCEWAWQDDQLWLLQVGTVTHREPEAAPKVGGSKEEWLPIVHTLVSSPGPLGAELILPWAVATGVPATPARENVGPDDLDTALQLSRQLTARVWGSNPDAALEAARDCLNGLIGPDQRHTLRRLGSLAEPDPETALELTSIVHGLREAAAALGAVGDPEEAWHLSPDQLRAALEGGGQADRGRVGSGRWEPLVAAIVLAHGRREQGSAASPGLGAGLLHSIPGDDRTRTPPPRSVLHSRQATPLLSQLLWDASGVVTHGGSPAAHLFESARSLGVPAVTGVDLTGAEGQIVAVDGFAGVVATLTLEE